MGNKHKTKKILSVLLAFVLFMTTWSTAMGADINTINPADYNLLSGSDFENGDTFGFAPGGGATSAVDTEGNGNKYLLMTGAGSGTRSIVKTLSQPTTDAEVLFTFDWKPETVSTGANNSEILFTDPNNNSLFRLVKAGGPDGLIKFGVGTTGTDLTQTQTVTNVTYNGSWLTAKVLFDFNDETVSLEIHDKNDASKSFSVTGLDISALNYVASIAKITVKGNRASGNTLGFRTGLDNISIYGSGTPAPVKGVQNIVSIVTPYSTQLTLPTGVTKENVIGYFPPALDVKLDNNVVLNGVSVNWATYDYNPNALGSYTFTGTLNIDGIANVANVNNVKASVNVSVVAAAPIPSIEGMEGVYYSDFGDTLVATPVNWGFTTTAATLAINTNDVGGNTTPKLYFNMTNQSGGRVATKNFDTSVKGAQILVKFDWYPGGVNDKGTSPSENGGELRLIDSSNNTIFTLNNTKNSPLSYFAGARPAAATGFTNPLAWYTTEISINLVDETLSLKLTEKASGTTENYTTPLTGMAFDGSLNAVKLVGLRTSGNNITWTTYLDNFGVYHVSIPDNRITKVDKLPYHRVYVNTTTEAISSIGLPGTVTVTLADNRKVSVPVSEWTAVDKLWNPAVPGVYKFKGTLAVPSDLENGFDRYATSYVYNRLAPAETSRQAEWLDRGVVALASDNGIFASWRLLADEYAQDVVFDLYRNGQKLNGEPLTVTNFADSEGVPGDTYRVVTLVQGIPDQEAEAVAADKDYLSIPMQKPEGGTTATGAYTYSVNDSGVGDLDGDGEYEVIVKWYPSNAIDSSQSDMTGPTIFDAYKLDGTLLWRMNMGLNLTSGAHYHQFVIADFDGDGKSEFLIKTADATTVYGVTNGKYDSSKVISVIGNPADNGKWVNDSGHIYGGPEYMSVFNGETGQVMDTIDYAFPLGDVLSWGDTWWNRSDRFLSGLAYLDGVNPSGIFGRGYYERTTFVAYNLVDGKLQEAWTFDSAEEGRGGGLGYHSLATADVDNDGFDEIIAGSLTLDHDGTILYTMDGEMGRERGSHGDALHVGAFDPDREGIQVFGVHEVPEVASVEYRDGATGETLASYFAYKDTGRGVAANITSQPGYEFWGTGGPDAPTGGGLYNVQTGVVKNSSRDAGLPVNFALYWDGDLLHELLDDTTVSKYNESTGATDIIRNFEGVMSSNGTKATPTLQADILGDWREEVLLPTIDSSELRIFSTTIPTEYRMFTLMHDPVYRNSVGWQNSGYNQPPHIGFYLGEDIRDQVLAGQLKAPGVAYTNEPVTKAELTGADQVRLGQSLEMNFGLANVNMGGIATVEKAVYAMDVTIAFDPSALEFVRADSLKDGVTIVESQMDNAGKLRLLNVSLGGENAITADGDLLKLTWKAKRNAAAGFTNLSVENAVLANGSGDTRNAVGVTRSIELRQDEVIEAAQKLLDQAVEGEGIGQYYTGSKARFLAALTTAKAVITDLNATAEQIAAAKAALAKAQKAFLAATGDLVGGNGVNVGDLGVVAAHYGKTANSPNWSDIDYIDIDGNGEIGLLELGTIARKILLAD